MSESTGAIILSPRLIATGSPEGKALENINTAVVGDGTLCYVSSGPGQGEWQLEKGSSAVPDGVTIVEPISGPGRWFIKILPGPNAGGGGVTSVIGINGITTISPAGPNVQVNGALLLPLAGGLMTGPINMGTNAITNGTYNGVALTTGGLATNFLNAQGNYVAVPSGGGTISVSVSALAATPAPANPGANSMLTVLLTNVAARTFQLPSTASATNGTRVLVKEAANSAAPIAITVSGGGNIDFSAAYNIATLGGSATFQFSSATNQWWVI